MATQPKGSILNVGRRKQSNIKRNTFFRETYINLNWTNMKHPFFLSISLNMECALLNVPGRKSIENKRNKSSVWAPRAFSTTWIEGERNVSGTVKLFVSYWKHIHRKKGKKGGTPFKEVGVVGNQRCQNGGLCPLVTFFF